MFLFVPTDELLADVAIERSARGRIASVLDADMDAKINATIKASDNMNECSVDKDTYYVVVFDHGGTGQRYLATDQIGRLCFCEGMNSYNIDSLFQDAAGTIPVTKVGQPVGRMSSNLGATTKFFTDAQDAKQVMDELSKTSFPNEGVLQVCAIDFRPVGKPSKGFTQDELLTSLNSE